MKFELNFGYFFFGFSPSSMNYQKAVSRVVRLAGVRAWRAWRAWRACVVCVKEWVGARSILRPVTVCAG